MKSQYSIALIVIITIASEQLTLNSTHENTVGKKLINNYLVSITTLLIVFMN